VRAIAGYKVRVCAMTDAEKKALIKKLGSDGNSAFDARFTGDNRTWFVAKIIDSLLAQGIADTKKIEQSTNDIITKSGNEVNKRIKAGFSAGSLPQIWKGYDAFKSRTQIIYGMIAMHPAFLDPANAGFFDFILERRYRAIQRMAFYVNPNSERNRFDYPSSACGDVMKVNKEGAAFWDAASAGTSAFILTAAGKSEPENAVETLFKKNKDCDRNLFACDPLATTLHLDALRAAKDPGKLLKNLVAVGDHYLKIDNPMGHFANDPSGQRLVAVTSADVKKGIDREIPLGKVGRVLTFSKNQFTAADLAKDALIPVMGTFFMLVLGADSESFLIDGVNPVTKKIKIHNLTKSYDKAGAKLYVTRKKFPFYSALPFHFVTDSRPSHALFEQSSLKSADFQVGDHVYVINHPLYLLYYPAGAWGGEHSFISEIGTRDTSGSAFRNQLLVEGHGLADTLLGMGNDMVSWINTVLGILQALTLIHLSNLKANGRKDATGVKFLTRTEHGVKFNVFEYSVPYTHKLFREGGKLETITAGFVIKELDGDPKVFQVFNANGSDSTVTPKAPQPDVFLRVAFIGASFSSDQFSPSQWGVQYFNAQPARFESQPLFEKDNKTPKLLTFEDLAKSNPFFVTDDTEDAYVTRPRVDFSAAYQTFLKNSGAI
jgi:hypothetical protein